MEGKRREVLCWNCRKKVMYTVKARKELQSIKGVDYLYNEMYAVCEECQEEITENAYRKVNEAIEEHERIQSHDTKIEKVALYMIQSGYEITNMSLQKLLYYFKVFGYVFLNKKLLDEECEAWI